MIKLKTNKDKMDFSKVEGILTIPVEPKDILCEVCKDDGLCKNSPSNKDYEKNNEDCWLGTDIYDCSDYLDVKKGKPKGSWMMEVGKRLKEKDTEKHKPSGFKEWSKQN
tara:strand:+ start:1993 stop:2319 length:327 start_codon:yes stop_codon:yes gene_type:complete